MKCYFQGCNAKGTTKEHIPPKAFFPHGDRDQLLTVKSCPMHNNDKSKDDLYVLAHICMNASPRNRAREVWENTVAPQLDFNEGKLRNLLANGAIPQESSVAYPVDTKRLDSFFTALSCGIVCKSQNAPLSTDYEIRHIYHNLMSDEDSDARALKKAISSFYSGKPLEALAFGTPDFRNQNIYISELYGFSDFRGSITIVHMFFGYFKVTTMLSKTF